MDIYRHNRYRDVIEAWIQESAEKGSRMRLARAARCTASWVTRVLNGNVHLTPDQALGVAGTMNLTEAETEYFLSLVDFERASTPELKKRLQKKMDGLKSEGRKLTTSIKAESTVSKENSVRYYSSWLYSAVHVACMLKAQTIGEIGKLLGLSDGVVGGAANELKKMGLLVQDGIHWSATGKSVHLSSDHPIAKVGHVAWRSRATQFLLEGHDRGLHYSAIHCLSQKDVEKLHAQLKKAILDCRSIIDQSASETLAVFCLDWFQLD